MHKMSSRKSRSDPPNHLSHLTWLVISSHLRRRDEPISAARATWALAAARDMASRAGRSPLVSPKSVAPAGAAGCRAAARRKSALRSLSASQIADCSKSKKKSGVCTRTSWAAMGSSSPSDCRHNGTLSHPGQKVTFWPTRHLSARAHKGTVLAGFQPFPPGV